MTDRVILPPGEYQGEFLQHWPDRKERGYITSFFHAALQSGIRQPSRLVAWVVDGILGQMIREDFSPQRLAVLNRLLRQISDDEVEAERYAEFLIERESWPIEKRTELRAISKAFYASEVAV